MDFVLLDVIPLIWSAVFCVSVYLMLGGKPTSAAFFAIPSAVALIAALISLSPKIQVAVFLLLSAFFIISEKAKKIKH